MRRKLVLVAVLAVITLAAVAAPVWLLQPEPYLEADSTVPPPPIPEYA